MSFEGYYERLWAEEVEAGRAIREERDRLDALTKYGGIGW